MNNALLHSFQTLKQVYADGAFSSIALNKTLNLCKNQDKALITKIVYGVLDNDIKLEYIISRFVRKMPKNDVLLYMKIGTYCLCELSMPVYAVVNDVAELSKLSADIHIVGFVNATLKQIAARLSEVEYPQDETERISVEYSYPMWALKKLIKDYGMDAAKQIATFKLPNYTTVRVCDDFDVAENCKQCGVQAQTTPFDDAYYIDGKTDGFTGRWTVQSLSSMAVARICAADARGTFLDCCAAPGGKAVYVKQLRPNLQVTACDIHEHRVQLIDSYAKRMGVEIATYRRDMTQPEQQWFGAFDTVLCDVPCSGFGVLDTRPDIKRFRTSLDISNLMKLQYAILDNCSNYVKTGGRLVYSTCTVFDNENGQNIRKFLKEHPCFTYGSINLPQFSQANGKAEYQFLPYKDSVQGFYVAVLVRTE